MDAHFTTQVFKEGRTFVADAPQLDVSSCGGTKDRALKNLREAVRLFLEEADKMGTLDQILEAAGGFRCVRTAGMFRARYFELLGE